MKTINPYLNFPGNTEEAFNFYKSIFGGSFIGGISRFRDMPGNDELSDEDLDKVMHVALPVGNNNTIMGTDQMESMGEPLTMGNNISLSIDPENKEEADRLFKELSEGGSITMPLQDTFWDAYFGMCTDKFGIQWMINYSYNQ